VSERVCVSVHVCVCGREKGGARERVCVREREGARQSVCAHRVREKQEKEREQGREGGEGGDGGLCVCIH